jgi:hypothetical protein
LSVLASLFGPETPFQRTGHRRRPPVPICCGGSSRVNIVAQVDGWNGLYFAVECSQSVHSTALVVLLLLITSRQKNDDDDAIVVGGKCWSMIHSRHELVDCRAGPFTEIQPKKDDDFAKGQNVVHLRWPRARLARPVGNKVVFQSCCAAGGVSRICS